MDAKLVTALIGLVGVLIGGVISAGANYILAVRKERADEEKDRRNHQIEIKRASRLVIKELTFACAQVEVVLNYKKWFERPLSRQAWDTYAPVLAPYLALERWDDIMRAYDHFDALNSLIPTAATQISGDVADMLQNLLEHLKAGAGALSEYE